MKTRRITTVGRRAADRKFVVPDPDDDEEYDEDDEEGDRNKPFGFF